LENLENTELQNSETNSEMIDRVADKLIEAIGSKSKVENKSIYNVNVKTTPDYTFKSLIHNMAGGNFNAISQYKAMNETTGTAGGYLVPEEFGNEVLTFINTAYGASYRDAKKVTFSRDKLKFPKVNQRPTAYLVSEGAKITGSSASLTQVTLDSDKLCVIQDMTLELLQDTAFDVQGFYAPLVAEQFAYKMDIETFTGTNGIYQASGINTVALTGTASSLNYDKIVDLVYSVSPAYRNGAKFYIHPTYVAQLMKIKDTTGNPIYRPGVLADGQSTLWGRPVVEVEALNGTSVTSSGAKNIVFGNLNNYYIGERSNTEIEVEYSNQATIGTFNTWESYGAGLRFVKRVAFACANPAAFGVLTNA
jgi:HK97 family phage major capsid protein